MLLSMTGFGEAHRKDALAVTVEVRTINSRYFKLVVRCGEGYASLEPLVENVVRQQASSAARCRSTSASIGSARRDDYQLNAEVLDGYRSNARR